MKYEPRPIDHLQPRPLLVPAPAHRVFHPHRGSSVLLVLLVLSIALSLSYAVMRGQSTTLQIQRNSQRNSMAKEAAVAGMTAALHRMRQIDWAGVNTTLTGNMGPTERFEVLYETGDPELTPAHQDFAQWPYRVTLTSTGFSADPSNLDVESSYQIQAVVQLVPRALGQAPAEWSTSSQYSIYQYRAAEFRIEVPSHLRGPLRLQSELQLVTSHSIGHGNSRTRYLSDLNAMRTSGYPDVRPITGPLHIPDASISSSFRTYLNDTLSVSTSSIPSTNSSLDSLPLNISTYRLYPGGQTYATQTLTANVQGQTLEPHPQTNPLGIYYRSNNVNLGADTTVRGTVLSPSRVTLTGHNITVLPYDLPSLRGDSRPVRLPVIAANDVYFDSICSTSIQGTMLAHRDVEAATGYHANILININGRLVTQALRVRGRTGWNTASWSTILLMFNLQINPSNGMEFFPIYSWTFGLNPNPFITLIPDATPVTDHWQNLNLPIYVPHPDDAGLLWDVIRWRENP